MKNQNILQNIKNNCSNIRAFTLAEVLITIGIIGVVAAMTLPTVVQSHRNIVAEVRLKKFYSTFNQAILKADAKYGDRESWYQDTRSVQTDEHGNVIEETSTIDKWFKEYLSDFITIKKEIIADGAVTYYLSDGSAFRFGSLEGGVSSRGVTFYIANPDKCNNTSGSSGSCRFYFLFNPLNTESDNKYHYKKGLEPGKYAWDGTKNSLYTDNTRGCQTGSGNYCTALIQYNGWKIPKDYPRKIRF